MTVLHSTLNKPFVVVDRLRISLVEITDYGVSIGVSDREFVRPDGVLSTELSEVCRNRTCYFWFAKNNFRLLVVRCRKGRSIVLSATRRLTVLDVNASSITVAITGMPKTELSFAGDEAGYRDEVMMLRSQVQQHAHMSQNREKRTSSKRTLHHRPWTLTPIGKLVHTMFVARRG